MKPRNQYDIQSIADRAKGVEEGVVLPEEVEFARTILRNRSGDIYEALYIVGLCGNPNDASLIEPYVNGPENNLYAEVALKALCRYLGLVDKYRKLLRELIMSTPEEEGARRMTAIHLAPEYFHGYRDDELGCELVRILCNLDDRDRSSARDALADILNLRHQLKDPHGLDFEVWDEDSSLLVDNARSAFGCSPIDRDIHSQPH